MGEYKTSILYPDVEGAVYKTLSDTVCHDLGLDMLCKKLSSKETEQRLIMSVLSKITDNREVVAYREQIFEDLLKLPDIRENMLKLLDKIKFIKDFGSFKRDSEFDKEAGIWDFMHRLSEISDYIQCVEAIHECLNTDAIRSEGLIGLRKYVECIYTEASFSELKKDIEALKADTDTIRSVTIGINVNERFEASGFGLISINNKHFKNSSIVSNFANSISGRNGIRDGNEWNGDMHYHPSDKDASGSSLFRLAKMNADAGVMGNPFMNAQARSTIINSPDGDATGMMTQYLNTEVDKMLSHLCKRLKDVLSKYVKLTINGIIELIPEFTYYIRFAEYIGKMSGQGRHFCKAEVLPEETDILMRAKGLYNFKLASAVEAGEEIVTNDLDFDNDHMIYILTGANRGGKTTITQAIGLLYVLAQGGIYVPADGFEFVPLDNIFTHFPADEDKSLDLGRLGEECTRFKEMYNEGTKNSLYLLNESFSTTSFEEGYYIACDAVRALLKKGARTIYNTHMHKLGYEIDSLNATEYEVKATSLVSRSEEGKRSFKVVVAQPEGSSYAHDIAAKYGVTYEMLTGEVQ